MKSVLILKRVLAGVWVLSSGSVFADQVIQYPAGGAQDLLHQTKISDSVRVPVDRDEPVCVDSRGNRFRKGEAGYRRCIKIQGIQTAPGAPQGVPGTSQTSGGITIKTH